MARRHRRGWFEAASVLYGVALCAGVQAIVIAHHRPSAAEMGGVALLCVMVGAMLSAFGEAASESSDAGPSPQASPLLPLDVPPPQRRKLPPEIQEILDLTERLADEADTASVGQEKRR